MRIPPFVAAVASLALACIASLALAADPPGSQENARLAFKADDKGDFVFDTGVVKGRVQRDGASDTLKPVTYIEPNVPIETGHGLLIPYRFLTPQKRYGFGSWEWPHTGRLLDDGGIELRWEQAADRPFAFSATYRWKAADTLDMTVAFTPEVDLEKFELFVGSYFRGFTKAKVYVRDGVDGKPGFVESTKDKGEMQLYPMNEAALAIVQDGRWKFPPYPNNWAIRPALAGRLGMKQEPKSGVTVLIMAPREDCFAMSASQQEAPLGAFYLSLFGKDVKQGQTLIGRARMVFGKDLTDEQAVQAYRTYFQDLAP
ncbi:MAG: hypothetical protein NTY19_09800 [Planctomycetota bacterium]|nr:hypothetical protein [Planctomycetota bacterium]